MNFNFESELRFTMTVIVLPFLFCVIIIKKFIIM